MIDVHMGPERQRVLRGVPAASDRGNLEAHLRVQTMRSDSPFGGSHHMTANHADVPFARPVKPVGAMKIALITTAGPGDRSHRDERNRRQVWSGQISNPPATKG